MPDQMADISKSLTSYSKSYKLGEDITRDILDGPVVIQIKTDGSQCSFGIIDGELKVRSKNKMVYQGDIRIDGSGMFERAVDVVKTLDLRPGRTYRCEFIGNRDCPKCNNGKKKRPTCNRCNKTGKINRHNAMEYGRLPKNMLVLFDVQIEDGSFLTPNELTDEANRIGVEPVPVLYVGNITAQELQEKAKKWLSKPSFLGGKEPDEGIVIKRYDRFDRWGKMLMAKLVRDSYKERQTELWKMDNPGSSDILTSLIERLATDARYDKAVQHGKEAGEVNGEMRDLAWLMPEVAKDLKEEEAEFVKEVLFEWAWPKIVRVVKNRFPHYYKKKLEEEFGFEV